MAAIVFGSHRRWSVRIFPTTLRSQLTSGQGLLRFTAPVEIASPGSNLQKELEIQLDEQGYTSHVHHRVIKSRQPSNRACTMGADHDESRRPGHPAFAASGAMDKDHFQSSRDP